MTKRSAVPRWIGTAPAKSGLVDSSSEQRSFERGCRKGDAAEDIVGENRHADRNIEGGGPIEPGQRSAVGGGRDSRRRIHRHDRLIVVEPLVGRLSGPEARVLRLESKISGENG